MPIASNQFLHASALIRVVLALLAGLRWLMTTRAEDPRVYTKRNVMLLYDGLGGLLLRWYLGTLSGNVVEFIDQSTFDRLSTRRLSVGLRRPPGLFSPTSASSLRPTSATA